MARIFITGATGQIGNNLVKYIVENKPLEIKRPGDILCLVRSRKYGSNYVEKSLKKKDRGNTINPFESSRHGRISPLEKLGVKIIEGDLLDKKLLTLVLEGVDYVFHLAANVYVYSSFEDMYEVNVKGTENLLDSFIKSEALLFAHTSSIIVYDTSRRARRFSKNSKDRKIYVFNEDSPLGTLERDRDVPYAVTKRLAEKLVVEYSTRYRSKMFVIARLSPVIGPGDRQMIPSFAKSMMVPLPKLIGGGKTGITLTAPWDVARALVFLAEKALNSKIKSGDVFNVAHKVVSFKELFSYVTEYYGLNPPSISIPAWLFKSLKPILMFIKTLLPGNTFIKTFFSSTAIEYLENSYKYESDKLKALGFNYKVSIRDSFFKALKELDPEKKLLG